MWILDSGVTDHITTDLNNFETYKPLETSNQITIANGTSVPITGQGKVDLYPILSIKQVLHVLNLATNLISVHQLTKQLNCRSIFYPHTCEFQDMNAGKMIGVVEEHNGLYFIKRESGPKGSQQKVACSSQSNSDLANIWLHHYRIGHPPFVLLKSIFPTLFRTLGPSIFSVMCV